MRRLFLYLTICSWLYCLECWAHHASFLTVVLVTSINEDIASYKSGQIIGDNLSYGRSLRVGVTSYCPLPWCGHLDFLSFKINVTKPRLEGEIVWFLFVQWILTLITVIGYRKHDQDGGSVVKAYKNNSFDYSTNLLVHLWYGLSEVLWQKNWDWMAQISLTNQNHRPAVAASRNNPHQSYSDHMVIVKHLVGTFRKKSQKINLLNWHLACLRFIEADVVFSLSLKTRQ